MTCFGQLNMSRGDVCHFWSDTFFFCAYFWEREKNRTGEGRKRERDRGLEVGSVLTAENPMWGLNAWTEIKVFTQLSHPGAPRAETLKTRVQPFFSFSLPHRSLCQVGAPVSAGPWVTLMNRTSMLTHTVLAAWARNKTEWSHWDFVVVGYCGMI